MNEQTEKLKDIAHAVARLLCVKCYVAPSGVPHFMTLTDEPAFSPATDEDVGRKILGIVQRNLGKELQDEN